MKGFRILGDVLPCFQGLQWKEKSSLTEFAAPGPELEARR